MREWPENLDFEEERCLNGREAFVIDFMPLVCQKPPAEHETLEIRAVRLFKAVLKRISETASEIHILGDKYDGLFRHTDPTGGSTSLKDCSGCYQLRGRCLTVCSFSTSSKIGNWTKIIANTKSKANLMKAIYETWEANGFVHISSLSTADTLRRIPWCSFTAFRGVTQRVTFSPKENEHS